MRACLDRSNRHKKALRACFRFKTFFVFGFSCLLPAFTAPETSHAQDRLKTLPGYENFQKMSRQMTNVVKSGALSVTWKDDGKAFEYQRDGKRYRYDIAAKKATEVAKASAETPREERTGRRGP